MTEISPLNSEPSESDLAAVERLGVAYRRIVDQLGRVIIGQRAVVEELLISMLAGGHALLVGVPGLAKTLMVRTLSETLNLSFNRIQFTPDLMPADITGTEVIQEDKLSGMREFKFIPGPVFANVLLADEINRTPPKTQAALLEAMQEHQVTAGGKRHKLPNPFFVLATQNPIEQEGTYPLPEAQLDRFLMEIDIDYPDRDAERRILFETTGSEEVQAKAAMTPDTLITAQRLVRRLPVGDSVVEAILSLVRSGPGPRASQALMLAVRARALLDGRLAPSIDDVLDLAEPVLKHRMALTFAARAEGRSIVDVINQLKKRIG